MTKKPIASKKKSAKPRAGEGCDHALLLGAPGLRRWMPPDELAHEIIAQFHERDEVFVLMGDRNYYGNDGGFTGLRLIANCLWQSMKAKRDARWQTPKADHDANSDPYKGAGHKRLAKIQAALEPLIVKCKLPWVCCFHVAGTAKWEMALSNGLSLSKAVHDLILFVKIDMDIDNFCGAEI